MGEPQPPVDYADSRAVTLGKRRVPTMPAMRRQQVLDFARVGLVRFQSLLLGGALRPVQNRVPPCALN
jgi:hypothetical protein